MEINNIIDVSQWQGRIDWDALKPYINGAIIRCGFGMDQVNQDDWQWARNVAECERLGIPYDAYFYSYSNGSSTQSEIAHCLRLLKGHHPDTIWQDLEEWNLRSAFRRVAEEFCAAMEAAGYHAGIYCGQEFWGNELKGFDIYEKWIPAYGRNVGGRMYPEYKPTIGLPMAAWQYTSTAMFLGINGNVDNSVFYRPFPRGTVKTEPAAEKGTSGTEKGTAPTGSTLELAEQVMLGRYGCDDARAQALGIRYDEVQAFINHIYGTSSYDLAKEVLTGKYGNGETRKAVLNGRYLEVQELVNYLVGGKQRQADSTYYYTVKAGDTVSGIANRMNVNWLEIARLNGLSAPYTIYVGQRLRIN